MISTNILKEKRLMICVKAFFITWAVLLVFCGTVKNPLSVILFLGSAFVLEKMQDAEKYKDELSIKLCAGFFSLATALSGFKTYTESFENKLFQLIIILVIISGMYLIYKQALMKLCQVLFDMKASNHMINESSADISEKIPTDTSEKIPVDTKGIGAFGILEKHPVIIPMIICFICFLPYFLYEYPGIMSADSLVQYEQVIGVRPWTNHHPIVHTLCIYVLYNIGYTVTGDATKAIAFYTVTQMLFMSYVCGRLHKTMIHIGISRPPRILTIAFYAIVPFNAVMSVTMWKDVPFAGVSVLLACYLLDFVNFKDENSSEKKLLINIRLYILGVAFSLMRTNAWYAFILTICLILWVFRKNIKRVLLTIGLIFLTVVLIKGPVMNTAGIEQPDFVESLCVPLQQVARVLVDGKELTASEKELIDNVIDTTYIKELYAADFADNIKELVRAGNPEYLESHKFEYFKLWAGLGLRYPGVYVMAWTDLTKGFWYPDVESEVAMIDGIMANDYGLVASPILRGKIVVKAKEIFLKLGNMIPLYGLLWSAGTYLWILCICLMVIGNSAYKGDRGKDMILMIPFIGIELTLFIATPVTDFRYVYSIVLAIPLIISVVTRGISDKAPEK